jgi:hypothetical protein
MIGHTNMFDLYNYSLLLIFAAGLGVILGLSEIGWQLGVRAEGKGGSNLATLESAMLGLLALMIAFTFSMALSRFDARRDAVLNEANAISTTALRARLLPEPHRAETLKLLTEYGPAHHWPNETLLSFVRTRFRRLSGSRQRPWPPKKED